MRNTIISVYNILGVIKNQIEMADYILAPNALEFSRKTEIDIFPLFDKNVHIYRVLATQEKKVIEIGGRSGYIRGRRAVNGNVVLLPAILLENAIKYAVEGSTISVDISEESGKVKVEI